MAEMKIRHTETAGDYSSETVFEGKADQADLKTYVKDFGKEALVELIIQKARGEI